MLIRATVPCTPPFACSETVEIKPVVDLALWEVTSIPLFCDEPALGDIVVLAYRSMTIVGVVTPSGLANYGCLYDGTGRLADVEERFRKIRDYLAACGFRIDGKGRGVFSMAAPRELGWQALTRLCDLAPERMEVATNRARVKYMSDPRTEES